MIYITQDFDALQKWLETSYESAIIRVFCSDRLDIKEASAISTEAYIAEKELKILAIFAKSYGVEAQNALLKLIEEPPRNIKFILAAKAKHLLLPTIRSRLPLKVLDSQTRALELETFGLNLAQLSLKNMQDFINEVEQKMREEWGKEELKQLLSQLILRACELYKFSLNEYGYFLKTLRLAELNTRPAALLTPLLLLILSKVGR